MKLGYRPPAVPLITCDPYFSVWSHADNLTDDVTRHWTGTVQELASLVRIDGVTYRLMGRDPGHVPAMKQVELSVYPTRTVYKFRDAGVEVTLLFFTPLLPNNLDLLARPVSYIEWEVVSTDGAAHQISVYFEASSALAVNTPDQKVVWSRLQIGANQALSVGSQTQPMLEKSGDDLRIDWGYLYAIAPAAPGLQQIISNRYAARQSFIQTGNLPTTDDTDMPRQVRQNHPVLAFAFDMGSVCNLPVSRYMALAYDDVFSIEYLNRRLRPYWRRNGANAADLLKLALAEFASLKMRCVEFDGELLHDLSAVGGEEYAALAALAYRQCIAAHKLVADVDGTPLFFSKENFSNGCIATVDVTYPAAPFYLLFNPELLKATTRPVFNYALLNRWQFDFAPHDVGTYPLANGQVYGGGERTTHNQMPVEECGNMLIMAGAVAIVENSAEFIRPYWSLLKTWAGYLKEKGFDPENQLCTDDFAGHLAHNTNLSLKAIVGLGAYARMCNLMGETEEAQATETLARTWAQQWVEQAAAGNHYRLTFDQPDSWSQKYNLVWDRLLNLNLFDPAIARTEIAFYKSLQNVYGLPLDNRKTWTKLDWIVWTATMAETKDDFAAFIAPVYKWLSETPSRVSLTDWYYTDTGKQAGFQARSVVGGIFIKMLTHADLWRSWRERAADR